MDSAEMGETTPACRKVAAWRWSAAIVLVFNMTEKLAWVNGSRPLGASAPPVKIQVSKRLMKAKEEMGYFGQGTCPELGSLD